MNFLRSARLFRLLALLGLAACAEACTTLHCLPIGCPSDVRVVLTGLAAKLGTRLPVTINACIDASCSTLRIDSADAGFACEHGPAAPNALPSCDVGSGDVTVFLPIPASPQDGEQIKLHVTATDAGGTVLFDGSGVTSIHGNEMGDPGCGICWHSDATLTS